MRCLPARVGKIKSFAKPQGWLSEICKAASNALSTSAGRRFWPDRSVYGKAATTMSPRVNTIELIPTLHRHRNKYLAHLATSRTRRLVKQFASLNVKLSTPLFLPNLTQTIPLPRSTPAAPPAENFLRPTRRRRAGARRRRNGWPGR